MGPDDADKNYGEPVDPGDITGPSNLQDQGCGQQRHRDAVRENGAEPDMHGQIIRSGLADRRGHDLDYPERERDLRKLVQPQGGKLVGKTHGDLSWRFPAEAAVPPPLSKPIEPA